ncbi:hypothetical protein H0I23_12710 [Cellulophaga sp. HaHaR_3_176]|uniref:hypothetical protein n=1 Tax=Cellulophaga sp. HaHaR_3_176 TaxID=1942464 RepID=UPI001C1FA44E|nr:hypothetical protein [Cellulophaga sp. HaHaR_3_176]QWX83308.1 hypothetical protein H0I23_12710 [Cellulophaga sp. HaHaR_3_176]
MAKFLLLFFLCCSYCFAQSINFDQLDKEKWLRYNGGISANGVYYDGTADRQNLTYYLTGNLNFNIAGLYNIPLSFTYSNQNFDFPSPFSFNRLSLHPSYKWATAHIGDVSMTFSPYTLSGHQFTGSGIELNPEGKFQVSAMYGRFLKATEYDSIAQGGITSYKRKGFGLKTAYDFDFMKLGVILFKASDDAESITEPFPTELNLSPKDNAVVSFESDFRVFDKANIHIEYAISGVTEDSRLTEERPNSGLLSFLLKENISTNYYNAINASFNYPAGNGSLGVGYERIDPDYKTLGAYYFNNDLENITVNASQTIFNNKLNLSVNAGLQQDNLDKAKTSEQQRIVSAINASLTASEKLTLNGSYSNFQSYTNIRDQFDYINQVGALDNVDTLNYRQVSQNANLGINYILKQTEQKQQSTNLNLVYQNSNNEQEGETIDGGESAFYNGTAAYTLGYPDKNLNISLAANTSFNTTGEDKSLTLGPTLAIGKQFFDKQLRTNFSSSYNTSYSNGEQQNNVYNFRLGSNYVWFEKHNLSLNFLMLFRNSVLNTNRDLTITFGYSYAFDNFKFHLNKGEKNIDHRLQKATNDIWSFRYKNVSYSGTAAELNEQLTNVFHSSEFANIPKFKKDDLELLLAITKKERKEESYKESALTFLKELYSYADFKETYEKALFAVIRKIQIDMRKIDIALERLFVSAKLEVDNNPLHNKKESDYTSEDLGLAQDYKLAVKDQETRLKKLVGHRWMETKFAEFTDISFVIEPLGYLREFKESNTLEAYKIFDETKDVTKLKDYLENEIIDFYYKKSLKVVNPESFELRYINKN